MSKQRKNDSFDDGAIGCVAIVFALIFAMPLVGIWMICSDDSTQRVIGVLLTIVGIILWIWMFAK